MKFEGKIHALHVYASGTTDPRVEVKLKGYACEDMPTTGDTHARESRCSAKLRWLVPKEYGDFLTIGQEIVVTIRTKDSDGEKLESTPVSQVLRKKPGVEEGCGNLMCLRCYETSKP